MLQEMTAQSLEKARSESPCGLLKSLDFMGAMTQSYVRRRRVLSKKGLRSPYRC